MDGPGHSGREAVGVMCPAACVCVWWCRGRARGLHQHTDTRCRKKNSCPRSRGPTGLHPNDWFFTGPPECGIHLTLRMYTPLSPCTRLASSPHGFLFLFPALGTVCFAPSIATLALSFQLPRAGPGRPAVRPIYPPGYWPSARCWPCSPAATRMSPSCLAPGVPIPPVVFSLLTPHYRRLCRCVPVVPLHLLYSCAHLVFRLTSAPRCFNPDVRVHITDSHCLPTTVPRPIHEPSLCTTNTQTHAAGHVTPTASLPLCPGPSTSPPSAPPTHRHTLQGT